MIGKAFTAIEWGDIAELVFLSLPEDDTLEFKRSFKGSANLDALTGKQRDEALDAIVREVIAFLNTRGGDIIVGLAENADGEAAELVGVDSSKGTAEKLSRAITSLIEPAQTNVTVRAISNPDDASNGILLIRVRASLRAPHRSKRTKECYVRRGTECVPMPMDEIQDLTLNRSMLRQERKSLIDRQFSDFRKGMLDRHELGSPVIHCRLVAQPMVDQEIELDSVLPRLASSGATYYDAAGESHSNDVAFRELFSQWKPLLRGKFQEHVYREQNGGTKLISSRRIKTSGLTQFDFAFSGVENSRAFTHYEWLLGFFADCCTAVRQATALHRQLLPASIVVGIASAGNVQLNVGRGMWANKREIPDQHTELPEFVVDSAKDLDNVFRQLQIDLASLAGWSPEIIYGLNDPNIETSEDDVA
jgi:hypothetical protein